MTLVLCVSLAALSWRGTAARGQQDLGGSSRSALDAALDHDPPVAARFVSDSLVTEPPAAESARASEPVAVRAESARGTDESVSAETGGETGAETDAATDAASAAVPPTASLDQLVNFKPGALSSVLAISVLSLAPAVLLMTTCFVRIAVVLGILRQALGMTQLPPTQVLTALSLFLTGLVMAPVWSDVYQEGIAPYRVADASVNWEEAWERGVQPLRRFMSQQIDRAGNSEDVWLFYGYLPESRSRPTPQSYDDIPLRALLPAFLISELKVAFLIGFQICLPFLVVDLVVASVTTSMGMMMVPPSVISLPMKLLLFVLLDGWRLIVGMLLESFAPYS